jgi:glycosylphosphatidylinositol deacylase
MPSVSEAITNFTRGTLPRLSVASFVVSLLPLPKDHVLGKGGEVFFAPYAPFVLLFATGLVVVSWWALRVLMWPIRKAGRVLARAKSETGITRTTVLLSMFLDLILVAFIIPWQVAFLISWSIHLVTCATYFPSAPGDSSTPPPRTRSPSPRRKTQQNQNPSQHDAEHLLLLMTWLLPLTAPVLAVWARTLFTAGLGAAIAAGGDHNVLSVAPFLVLVDLASWTRDALFPPDRYAAILRHLCFPLC